MVRVSPRCDRRDAPHVRIGIGERGPQRRAHGLRAACMREHAESPQRMHARAW
jgi:hypothetical protein